MSVLSLFNPVRGFLMSVDVEPPIRVRFQYNPTQLNERVVVDYAALNAPGAAAPTRQWSHGGGRTISFTVRLDAVVPGPADKSIQLELDQDGGLSRELNKYRALAHPTTPRWREAQASFLPLYTEQDRFMSPPRCRFGFGAADAGATARVIECVVTELSVTELQFNARLAPVRADVALTLTEIAPLGGAA